MAKQVSLPVRPVESVGASSIPVSIRCAFDVQTSCRLTTQSYPVWDRAGADRGEITTGFRFAERWH